MKSRYQYKRMGRRADGWHCCGTRHGTPASRNSRANSRRTRGRGDAGQRKTVHSYNGSMVAYRNGMTAYTSLATALSYDPTYYMALFIEPWWWFNEQFYVTAG